MEDRIRRSCRQSDVYLAYDNFNFLDTIRDQRLGHSRPMQRNMTSALLISCPAFPSTGLRQSMLDRSRPLDIDGITGRIRKDARHRQLGKHFIASAIRQIYPTACRKIFDSAGDDFGFPGAPVWDALPFDRSELIQLGSIFYDEGRLDGTYNVHRDIFLDKFGLNADTDFDERLWIVQGDQKTVAFIRRLQAQQYYASRAYDRRRWMVAPPALFHTLQNFILCIVRSHFEAPSQSHSMETLLHDISVWQRYGISRENVKFHLMEPLITQGWSGRLLAIFYSHLIRDGHIPSHVNPLTLRLEEGEEYVKGLSAEYFHSVLDQIYRVYMMKPAWEGVDSQGQPIKDAEYISMCRYLQEVEYFLFVRHAVRHGDIGLLDSLIDILGLWFAGAGQTNYALEMLHFRWLLDSSSPELRHALLASSVVNPSGKPGKFKATDLAVEHMNFFYRLDINMRKNSTHDVDKTFGRFALCSPVFAALRTSFESYFGYPIDGTHSHKKTAQDIHHLATILLAEHRTAPRLDSQLPPVPHNSPNLLKDGYDDLDLRVESFNSLYIQHPERATVDDVSPDQDTEVDPNQVEVMENEQERREIYDVDSMEVFTSVPTAFTEPDL